MLPEKYRDRYEKFQQALEQMQGKTAQNLDFGSLREDLGQLQQIFREEIASSIGNDLNPATSSRLQSYLTEIDKQLRLLEMDVMFLQAAQKPATVQTRVAQINSRLQTTIGYCQAIIQTASTERI